MLAFFFGFLAGILFTILFYFVQFAAALREDVEDIHKE